MGRVNEAMTEAVCRNCKHIYEPEGRSGPNDLHARCRRFPPQFVLHDQPASQWTRTEGGWKFPIVGRDQWCGEFAESGRAALKQHKDGA